MIEEIPTFLWADGRLISATTTYATWEEETRTWHLSPTELIFTGPGDFVVWEFPNEAGCKMLGLQGINLRDGDTLSISPSPTGISVMVDCDRLAVQPPIRKDQDADHT
jgi:hypothetical protein